jgi:translation initiation factor 1
MTKEVCASCGLPPELCLCEEENKKAQDIRIDTEQRRFDKYVTLVKGVDPDEVAVDELISDLKRALACGGTVHDDGTMELQGDHRGRIEDKLDDLGFAV